MWRRYGEDAYALVLLAVFGFEALALGGLAVSFLGGAPSLGGSAVVAALIVTGLSLAVVTASVLVHHTLSARTRHGGPALERWTRRWVGVLLSDARPPRVLLRREAAEALVELREVVRGDEARRLDRLVRRYGITARLVRRLQPSLIERVGRGSLAVRAEALEQLSRLRAPDALVHLRGQMDDDAAPIRIAATRAVARTVASMEPGPARDAEAAAFGAALLEADLPRGVVEEALILLGPSAVPVLEVLLDAPTGGPLPAVLGAIGRLRLIGYVGIVARAIGHPEPEVRAAALRAIARIGSLPQDHRDQVRAACEDIIDYVRAHAVRASYLLGRSDASVILWERLGDPSWWVRRAAGETLVRLGPHGREMLARARREHPDRYARHMADRALADVHALLEASA